MKVFAICLLTLIVASNGLQMLEKYPGLMNFSKKRSIMAVMAQVEALLKNGGPLDAITKLLDDYNLEIRAEQLAHDQLYEKQTAECVDEFQFRRGEVAEAVAAIKEATETLSACKQQQDRAREDLRITIKQLKEKNAELLNVHTTRTRERYAFETGQGVFEILHPAVGEALGYLEELFSGEGSFLQMAKRTNKILISAVQLGHGHHLSSVLGVLAQMASKTEDLVADQALLEKLENMFINFRTKIEQENAIAIKNEEVAIAKYNADVTRIEGIIKNLEAQKLGLENELEELKKCIEVQTNILTTATAKRDRNQNLLDKAIKMCAAMDRQYESAKAGRLAELDLLQAITVKVHEHFAKLSAGVTRRGELDNFDDEYSNASEYNQKEFARADELK